MHTTSNGAAVQWLNVLGVAERYGVSRATVFNLLKAGELPKGIRITRRNVRWRADALDEFDRQRAA